MSMFIIWQFYLEVKMNDTGNLAWMITASALVLLMTPGLAFFYGGLVRAKNIVNTMMFSFISMGLATIVWVLWGYSLAFSGGGPFIGNLEMIGLNGLDVTDGDAISVEKKMGMWNMKFIFPWDYRRKN